MIAGHHHNPGRSVKTKVWGVITARFASANTPRGRGPNPRPCAIARSRSPCRGTPPRSPPCVRRVLQVTLADALRVGQDFGQLFQSLEQRRVAEREVQLGRVERVKHDDLVLLIPQPLQPCEDVWHVVEQVAEDERDPTATRAVGDFAERSTEIRRAPCVARPAARAPPRGAGSSARRGGGTAARRRPRSPARRCPPVATRGGPSPPR